MTRAIGSGIIEIAREIASATVCVIVSENLCGIVIASAEWIVTGIATVPLIVTAIATVIEIVIEIDVIGIVPTRVIIDGIVSVNGGDNLAMNFRLLVRELIRNVLNLSQRPCMYVVRTVQLVVLCKLSFL
jgi:hypothetical protein